VERDTLAQMMAQLRYYFKIEPSNLTITEITERFAELEWVRMKEKKEQISIEQKLRGGR